MIVELGSKSAQDVQPRSYETSLLGLNNASVLLIEDDEMVLNATNNFLNLGSAMSSVPKMHKKQNA